VSGSVPLEAMDLDLDLTKRSGDNDQSEITRPSGVSLRGEAPPGGLG
jgi:hypothetical protein